MGNLAGGPSGEMFAEMNMMNREQDIRVWTDRPMIEIALMDAELEKVISDMGFASLQMRNLSKILKFDGWKAKESYPITMSGAAFGAWMSVYKGKKKVSQPQKIRIRQARKQKYEKRRLEKAARQRPMK